MQSELVERRRWIGQARFLHALNFCMLLPGPEAQQLAIYIGWLLHRTAGGIAAGALFVLPSIFILWALSFVYAAYEQVPSVAAIFYGLKPAVLAIVAIAVIRIGRKALNNVLMWSMAVLAFVGIFFLHIHFLSLSSERCSLVSRAEFFGRSCLPCKSTIARLRALFWAMTTSFTPGPHGAAPCALC